MPGFKNHVWLEVHHLRPRSEGGNHAHGNLTVLCAAHHDALHRGFLVIERSADATLRFSHADGTPYGEAPRPADVDASSDAFAALRGLGFSETESRQALAAARTHVGAGASAEALITAALRRTLDRAA
ncbi:MAG: hypothetical protein AMXMBFR64_52210 [Myxococcales bacterium]